MPSTSEFAHNPGRLPAMKFQPRLELFMLGDIAESPTFAHVVREFPA